MLSDLSAVVLTADMLSGIPAPPVPGRGSELPHLDLSVDYPLIALSDLARTHHAMPESDWLIPVIHYSHRGDPLP
jgi:hypothetical protein